MKSNWTTDELKQALDPEAITKLDAWHQQKVVERERQRKAKAALRAISMQKVTEVLGAEAAVRLQEALAQVQTAAQATAATVNPSPEPSTPSSPERRAASSRNSQPSRRRR